MREALHVPHAYTSAAIYALSRIASYETDESVDSRTCQVKRNAGLLNKKPFYVSDEKSNGGEGVGSHTYRTVLATPS